MPGVFDVMAKGFVAKYDTRGVCELKPYDFDG